MLRKLIIAFISALLCTFALTLTVFAEETYVYDEAELFSKYELSALESQLAEVSQATGWKVIVLTTNDIGDDKSDYGATDYADMYFETRYGQETDGILYMINNDTKYDRISTSGVCIQYFTDYRIERVFDYVWDDMLNEKYFNAMIGFVTEVKLYYNRGIDGNQYTTDDYSYGDDGEIVYSDNPISLFESFVAVLPFFIFVMIVISIIMYASYKNVLKGYRMKHVVSANPYIMPDSVVLSVKQDSFVREYTTRTRVSSSSSGHSSGHSSSHRSSGGGHHGGGGRHR